MTTCADQISSQTSSMSPPCCRRRRSVPSFVFPALTPLAVAAVAAAVEAVTRERERKRRRRRGQLIALRSDGRRLHVVYDAGLHTSSTNTPCVVLEAGANSWSSVWDDVSDRLGRITRVLRYDRFGYGFSDGLSSTYSQIPRSPASIAKDLCIALTKVGAYPPYVFVAHSLGALYINAALQRLRPGDVCGVVYVDAASTQTIRMLRGAVPTASPPAWLAHALAATGVLRLFAPLALRPYWDAFPPTLREEARAVWARAEWLLAYTAEWSGAMCYSDSLSPSSFSSSSEPTAKRERNIDYHPGWLEDIPIAVLVPDIYDKTEGKAFVSSLQEQIALYSSDATTFRVENSGHFVQIDRPDVVVDAIAHVIQRARDLGRLPSAHSGSGDDGDTGDDDAIHQFQNLSA